MAGTGKVYGAPLRLRRTAQVKELLEEIWAFRPELSHKNTMTLIFGLKAFLEECQLKDLKIQATFAANLSATTEDEVVTGTEKVVSDDDNPFATVSDDIEW